MDNRQAYDFIIAQSSRLIASDRAKELMMTQIAADMAEYLSKYSEEETAVLITAIHYLLWVTVQGIIEAKDVRMGLWELDGKGLVN